MSYAFLKLTYIFGQYLAVTAEQPNLQLSAE